MASVTDSARARLISAPFVVVTAATLAFFVFVGIAVSTLPRFIEDELGGDGLAIGINLAVFSIAAIAARPMIARIGDRFGRRFLMVGGALLAGAAIATTAFVHSLATLLPLRAISGVGEAALFVGAATLIADLSPSQRRAEGASYFSWPSSAAWGSARSSASSCSGTAATGRCTWSPRCSASPRR